MTQIINQQFPAEVEFLQLLARAKSANPYTADNSPSDVRVEAEVAAIIHEHMQRSGWPSRLIGVTEARPNVFCHLPGSSTGGKTLILNTHMDTVPASDAYTRDPWSADIVDGRLYGLGAADAKAQIAAFVYAIRAIQQAGIQLAGSLKLAFVADEETGACSPYGTRYLLEQGLLDGDAALIGEPGDERVAIGHRGLYRFLIRTRGQAVHTGSKKWEEKMEGHNAVLDMTHIIQALSQWELPSAPSAAFPGRKNVLTFPTLIQGGSGINIVPELCEAYGDTRLLPGVSAAMVRVSIESYLKPLSLPYELQEIVFVPAVETAPREQIVQVLADTIANITATQPPLEGVGPACDGWMFAIRGIPTVCGYGVNCGGVHGADEWVDLESLQKLTRIYAATFTAYTELA